MPAQSSSSSSAKHVKPPAASSDSTLDSGTITNGVYRNKTLGFSCKIPDAWVLRTDELNGREESQKNETEKPESERPEKDTPPQPSAASSTGARVLLAAFSRPPEAKGEEVNSSILIAAESVSSYPGLKEAVQYFGPLTEVAKAQGFTLDEEPYEIAVETKTLVRADFHKDVGTRVMRQSTLAMLSHGYAISITVIAGTEDDVEELIDGLSFTSTGK
ncbi:MAG TPA: hypothetical protein VFE61_21345 [Candidatus Sulfotelmatobacter sp.]|nr:hypothetical protein [Candidatus Sulfotelmatobacter sp.]